MLNLIDVKKSYRVADTEVKALKGISLHFRKSEFVSVLGPSGCGKTTLLNIIGGLDKYDGGEMFIQGKSTKKYKDSDWDIYRNHRIGFVFQSYNLIPHQTVLGNVELALTIAGLPAAKRKQKAKEALIKVGLGEQLNKHPNQLSGGQMQRVAIARAIVNDPEILLADEPTGALDTQTSVQIMELIKEIAKDKLVIMVTHNPELAEQYSSRIVRLKDGEVVSDSDPYDGEMLVPESEKRERAKMGALTSLALSARNLWTKKGRTSVTAFAGSIGIIGVSLVLALSSGFNNYIAKTQEDMLSAYPINITEQALDFTTILANVENNVSIDMSRLDDKVYVNSFLTKLADGMTTTNNISKEYLDYVALMNPDYYHAVQYDYGNTIEDNIYTSFELGSIGSTDGTSRAFSAASLSFIKETYGTLLTTEEGASEYASMSYLMDSLSSVFAELPDNKDYILEQYDVICGKYPESANEIVMVVNSNNQLTDLTLAQLGYLSVADFLDLFENKEEKSFEYDEILGKKFYYYPNDSIYFYIPRTVEDPSTGMIYPQGYFYNSFMNVEQASVKKTELNVVGVLRVKDDRSYGALSSGMYFTKALQETVRKDALNSQVVKDFADGSEDSVNYFALKEGVVEKDGVTLRTLGGESLPDKVSFYAKDFETKELLCAYLDAWNDAEGREEKDKVVYSDNVGVMISLVKDILNAVTYVLVAFTAISLVVSSVMIGVITFVSVVERTKEIGILRSLGSSKSNIRNLFNAETFIIGLLAGLFGIGITYLISIVVNVILVNLTGIANLAALPFWQALVMVAISVVLTLISGLIPAQSAARRDPVKALRSE